MNIKPCPFCGRKAILIEIPYAKKVCRFKEKIPKDALNVQEVKYASRSVWKYEIKGYCPQCSDPSCIGRIRKRYVSEYTAIKAWNQRAGLEE